MTDKRWRTGRGIWNDDYFSETIIDEETGEKYYGGIKAVYVSSSEIVEILNNYEKDSKKNEKLLKENEELKKENQELRTGLYRLKSYCVKKIPLVNFTTEYIESIIRGE